MFKDQLRFLKKHLSAKVYDSEGSLGISWIEWFNLASEEILENYGHVLFLGIHHLESVQSFLLKIVIAQHGCKILGPCHENCFVGLQFTVLTSYCHIILTPILQYLPKILADIRDSWHCVNIYQLRSTSIGTRL